MENKPKNQQINYLKIHYELVVLLYVVAAYLSYSILTLPDAQKNLVTLISSGAIFATFGSAIGTIGLIWQTDLLERVKINVDILFKDILKDNDQWRRWPFLPRFTRKCLLDQTSLHTTLSNPKIPLNVGSHVIEIEIPTVLEDFYDLPLFKNFWPLIRFRNAAHTTYSRTSKDKVNSTTDLKPMNEYMAYECMYDIWKSILKYRFARYILHLGSGLTISGALTVMIFVVATKYM